MGGALQYCIGGMHLSIHYSVVLEGCISQYITVLYWRDASFNTLQYCTGGMHLSILYWRDASFNTLQCCIGGMHLSIHYGIVLEGCIFQYITVLYWWDASLNIVLEGACGIFQIDKDQGNKPLTLLQFKYFES